MAERVEIDVHGLHMLHEDALRYRFLKAFARREATGVWDIPKELFAGVVAASFDVVIDHLRKEVRAKAQTMTAEEFEAWVNTGCSWPRAAPGDEATRVCDPAP